MGRINLKAFGLVIVSFSLGTIVQIFVPDIFIIIMYAVILLAVGLFILLKC